MPDDPMIGGSDERNTMDLQQRIIICLQQKLEALQGQAESHQAKGSGMSPNAPWARSREAGQLGELRQQWDLLRRSQARSSTPPERQVFFHNQIDGEEECEAPFESWVVSQFRCLNDELQEKEQLLANKTRLLTERDEQLGQLGERLQGNRGSLVPRRCAWQRAIPQRRVLAVRRIRARVLPRGRRPSSSTTAFSFPGEPPPVRCSQT